MIIVFTLFKQREREREGGGRKGGGGGGGAEKETDQQTNGKTNRDRDSKEEREKETDKRKKRRITNCLIHASHSDRDKTDRQTDQKNVRDKGRVKGVSSDYHWHALRQKKVTWTELLRQCSTDRRWWSDGAVTLRSQLHRLDVRGIVPFLTTSRNVGTLFLHSTLLLS